MKETISSFQRIELELESELEPSSESSSSKQSTIEVESTLQKQERYISNELAVDIV